MSTFGNNPFQDEHNPFAPPQVSIWATENDERPAALIRKEHLSHEASVQSIGVLYLLGSVVLIFAAVIVLAAPGPRGGNRPDGFQVVLSPILLLFGVGQGFLAFGLRRLRGWTRIPTGILSAFGLLGFPLGTLISAYILYLIFSKKGAMVFSDEYKEIIRQTPEMKYRTSIVVWIFLGLLLLLIGVGIISAFFLRQG